MGMSKKMNREEALRAVLDRGERWEVLVIGGGATGLGAAVDAAARGYRTLLLEQHDFAKGTSSRSTKLVHGGVRYLRQGRIALVRESLHERGLLLRNAPHLVRKQSFLVPASSPGALWYYGAGLKLYDLMAGRLGFGPSRLLSRDDALRALPGLNPDRLAGAVEYFDGQFDDARLALALAQTLFDLGGVGLNYAPVHQLLKENGRVSGVIGRDAETGKEFEVRARAVINATGVFTDSIRHLDHPGSAPLVIPSQGAHLVVDHRVLPAASALMVPKTPDGRVLFVIPWHNRLVIGTTDTPVPRPVLEPRPLAHEIRYLLEQVSRYLAVPLETRSVLSVFAGLRPLVQSGSGQDTARISRDHRIVVSPSGLVTIAGGKWTTYRKMAEDVVDQALEAGGLSRKPCATRELRLHGFRAAPPDEQGSANVSHPPHWKLLGSDAVPLRALMQSAEAMKEPLHARLPFVAADVLWSARHEMARSVEDVLARRTRALLLDAQAAREAAPTVANLLAHELGRDEKWQAAQVAAFQEVAAGYLCP